MALRQNNVSGIIYFAHTGIYYFMAFKEQGAGFM